MLIVVNNELLSQMNELTVADYARALIALLEGDIKSEPSEAKGRGSRPPSKQVADISEKDRSHPMSVFVFLEKVTLLPFPHALQVTFGLLIILDCIERNSRDL